MVIELKIDFQQFTFPCYNREKKWGVIVKNRLSIVFVFCFVVLAACSNLDNSESKYDEDISSGEESAGDIAEIGMELSNDDGEKLETESQANEKTADLLDRKVIYTADLQVEVKSYQQTLHAIQNQVTNMNGYIVESSMYEEQESGAKIGQITARVPQDTFQEFIKFVEDDSSKVVESSISGQDVTEEYVDLESRLKSKRVVEDRLVSFMNQAKKTDDLLKISSDLAKVQEEIETITGRMQYLQNKSDLATITIYIEEKNVKISGTGKDHLNTWEQTEQQFMKSINFIITAFSSLFILFVGNLPIILLISSLLLFVYLAVKRRRNRRIKDK